MDGESDSEQSQLEGDFSHFSLPGDSSRNSTTNDSQHDKSNRNEHSSNVNDTVNESLIVSRKKKQRKPIWDSDSESDQKNSDQESNESNDSDEKSHNDSDDESKDSDDESNDSYDESNDSDEKTRNNSGDESSEMEQQVEANDTDNDNRNDSRDISMVNERSHSARTNNDTGIDFESHRAKSRSYDSDDSLVENSNSNQNGSDVIPATDDEDDDDEKEKSQMHVFSPRTRRSITGRRSIHFPSIESDDDEIFTNEDSSEANRSRSTDYKSAEGSKIIESSIDDDDHRQSESAKRNRSIAPNDSAMIRTPNSKRFSVNASNVSASLTTSTPSRSRSTPDIEFSLENSDASKSSSIHIHSSNSEQEMKSTLNDSSVVLLNSSDEENHAPYANSTAVDFKSVAGTSTPGSSSVRLIQPKLQFGTKQSTTKVLVSREYYQQKSDELAHEKQELKDIENLLANVGSSLPDRGRNLEKRIQDVTRGIQKKESELEKYAIEEDNLNDVKWVETTNNNQAKNGHWRDELETIQPRFTGQQGLSTFNQQKTLTLNRIEKLHKAMEKCPMENDLAIQPDNLNVQLMPHQLHAIKWMRWRENQKPKGGLLADDMGLGKTLTVIGLVLDAKYRKNHSLLEEEDDDNTEDEEEDDDDENDRGFKKSFANQGGTLIVCPASLINQWEHEIENRVKRRKLTVLMHHGSKRKESSHSICKYDLVITTYGIISSDHKVNGCLFRIRWDRIVLDEAHMIRNHSTAVSKGCCSLRSTTRWGLTGTPIQNKHMDVYSMLKFLRVTPFDDLPTFKKWIDPKTEAGMSRLHSILKPMLLRRTKSELQIRGELQALPTKTMVIVDIELSPQEANVYTKILAYSQTLFAQYMEQHQQRNGGGKVQLNTDIQRRLDQVKRFGRGQDVKSSQILVLLLRLRQICDHPGLIHQMLQDECDIEDAEDEEFDALDMNMVKQMIGLKINEGDNGNHEHNNSSEHETNSNNVLLATNRVYDFKQPSSKCKRVIEISKKILRETDDKIVIVSQWTSFLNIVADFLNREKVHYVELTGKTPIKDRNNIVVSFNSPDTPERVLMLSLVAGGVGLNLTGANHLILLDPHWNPQLESQAFDRVYRVGQSKDVHIYKLLCVKTVEKHIQLIQDNKLALSDNVLTGSKSSGSKLSIQDMRRLFEL